jgi:hypothetical protein
VQSSPQPIDTTARRQSIRFCNASRARRFSVDPARRAWYAAHRQRRFSTGLFGAGGA